MSLWCLALSSYEIWDLRSKRMNLEVLGRELRLLGDLPQKASSTPTLGSLDKLWSRLGPEQKSFP